MWCQGRQTSGNILFTMKATVCKKCGAYFRYSSSNNPTGLRASLLMTPATINKVIFRNVTCNSFQTPKKHTGFCCFLIIMMLMQLSGGSVPYPKLISKNIHCYVVDNKAIKETVNGNSFKNTFTMTGWFNYRWWCRFRQSYLHNLTTEIPDRQSQGCDWRNKNIIMHQRNAFVHVCVHQQVRVAQIVKTTQVEPTAHEHTGLQVFYSETPPPPTKKEAGLGKYLLHSVAAVTLSCSYALCVFYHFRMESTEKCDAVISHFNGKFIKTPAGVPGKVYAWLYSAETHCEM